MGPKHYNMSDFQSISRASRINDILSLIEIHKPEMEVFSSTIEVRPITVRGYGGYRPTVPGSAIPEV